MKLLNVVLFIFFLFLFQLSEAKRLDENAYILDTSQSVFDLIKSRSELTIDHVTPNGFELYGPVGMREFLTKNNITFKDQDEILQTSANQYPSFDEMEKELKNLANSYPQILKLYSIGKSVKGKNLWVMKLSKNVNQEDSRPEFKYIANMHGDEIVGRELMMRLIKYMALNYGSDQKVTELLSKIQIHILPSMNPDGAAKKTRANANNVDLNRDFPDFSTTDNQNNTDAREVETVALMNWQKAHHFILSANFHGGAEVVNYPWDTVSDLFPKETLVKELSTEYAMNAAYIGTSTTFTNGITNGYSWYEVNGGMQDWSIYYQNDLQLTIELSNTKWPNFSEIDYYFDQNKEALLHFIGRTVEIKQSSFDNRKHHF
jgi:hypothetical protein